MSEAIHPLAGVIRSQRYRDYQRQRQYGTGDILLDNRIIFFGVSGGTFYSPEINDVTANVVIQQLLYLQYENKSQEIHFYINSPGRIGDLDPGDLRHHAVPRVPGGHLLHGHGGERGGDPAGQRRRWQGATPCRTPRS